MNSYPDQPVEGRPHAGSATAFSNPENTKVAPVDPPATRKSWYSNYDEEWADFLARSTKNKKRPGINNEEPESLPRVWNTPHV